MPENMGLFAYKGRFRSILGQPLVLLTPAALTLIRFDMKNVFCVSLRMKTEAVRPAALLLTRIVPPVELLTAFFGSEPVTSI